MATDAPVKRGPGRPPKAKPQSFYDEYEGEREWFLGVKMLSGDTFGLKADFFGLQRFSIRGLQFVRSEQPVTVAEDDTVHDGTDDEDDIEAGVYASVGAPIRGRYQSLEWQRIRRFLDTLPSRWMRLSFAKPKGKTKRLKRAEESNMEARTSEPGRMTDEGQQWVGKSWATAYQNSPLIRDVPASLCLVLLPADYVASHGGRENLDGLPSIADLCPETLTYEPRNLTFKA